MGVVGIVLSSIEARKMGDVAKGVKINNKVTTTGVRESEIPGISKKGLIVTFKFETTYKHEDQIVAQIVMDGNIFYIGDDVKTIMKAWEKDKQIPDDPHIEIINNAFRKCVSRAITLSEDVQLPPPIGMPFAQKKE